MIIFTLSPWMIFLLVLCVIASIYGIIQNIGSIILISIAVIVLILLLGKWPIKTFIGLVSILLLSVVYFSVSSTIEANNTPVLIYKATNTCSFYDEQGTLVQIPSGAIVAKYRHPKQESKEKQYNGNSHVCNWYYDGEVFSSTTSVIHEGSLAEKMNVEKNIWSLEEIREITYKEFRNGNWWT